VYRCKKAAATKTTESPPRWDDDLNCGIHRVVIPAKAGIQKNKLSNFDFCTQLYNAVGWNLEKVRRLCRILHHPGKQPFTPHRHARQITRHDRIARQEE
jgi:hypothetical protein